MRENYPQIHAWIGMSEGGYVNHPADPGGATDRGITQRTYDAWRKSRGLAPHSVRGISKGEAETIIERQYMDKVGADDLPAGLDYAMADYSVNSGPSRAAKELQRILGVTADGIVGAETLAAVLSRDPAALVVALCEARMGFLKRLRHWQTFRRGWTERVMGRVDGVQTDDIGVIDRGVRMARGSADIPAPKPTEPIAKAPDIASRTGWAALIAAILSFFRKGS